MRRERGLFVSTSDRISYVDGLRGVAIAMVVAYHLWQYVDPHFARVRVTLYNSVITQGYAGVYLFLVLSGFCLALPPLKRRRDGAARWFSPSQFFARRCMRILPPYYVALALFVMAGAVATRARWYGLTALWSPPAGTNLLSHLLLLHNNTPYTMAINPSFWSLGLEWQWYWVFPPLLILSLRAPRLALALSLGVAVAWYVSMRPRLDSFVMAGTLPIYLFDFCCGIVVARVVAAGRAPSRRLLALGIVLPLIAVGMLPVPFTWHLQLLITRLGVKEAGYGLAFASLVLLGARSRLANAVLSSRPLVALGLVSYSVYLVHQPVLQAVAVIAPTAPRNSLLVVLAAILCALFCGVVFHLLVERPCLSGATWSRVGPTLTGLFGWTDLLWDRFVVLWPERERRVAPEAALDGAPDVAR